MEYPQFFRSLFYELKWALEDLILKIKHPTRPCDFWEHIGAIRCLFIDTPFRCLKRGIRNLYRWFPVIWKTDSWDYCFLTELMDKQMSYMQKFFESDKTHLLHARRVAKQIKWTRRLYDMWIDGYYIDKFTEQHYVKWERKGLFESKPCQWDDWGVPTTYKSSSNMPKEQSDEYKDGSAIAYEKDEKVFRLYCKSLKRLRNWWD